MYRGGGGYDERPSHYGGGGGGGGDGGYNRGKRGHDDDQYGGGDDRGGYKRSRHEGRDGGNSYYRPRNNNYNGGGGDRRYGGGNNNYDRRAPVESDSARAWRLTKKAIVELGENTNGGNFDDLKGNDLREHLLDAASKIRQELDADPDVKLNHISSLVVRCVGRLAHKTSLYAVVTGLVHEKQSDFGRKVLEVVLEQLQKDVDFFHTERYDEQLQSGVQEEDALRKDGDVNGVALRIRLLVRFLGELVSVRVVKTDDLLSLLDTLQGVCTPDDFNSESEEPLRTRENAAAYKDFFASIVLDTLLHAGQSLSVGCEDIYESLLSRCKEYISTREEESNPRGSESEHTSNWLSRRLRLDLVWEPETDEDLVAACKKNDPLSLQWEALNLLRGETNPQIGSEMNPHLRWKIPGVLYPQELFEKSFTDAEPQSLSTSVVVDLSGLDQAKIPRYEAVFRIFGEDSGAVGAPLANLHLASYLITRNHFGEMIEGFYPKPAATAKHVLGLARSYNARFADVELDNVKAEHILLESLLIKALNERDAAQLGYLCSVLTNVIKVDARMISSAFAIVVELLFREIPLMNAGAIDSFVKLFSHFLSNFEYKWAWARWAHVLEAQEDDAQRLFVSSVIERCVRLSYLQHMQSVLPGEFHSLLPPEPKPRVIYQDNDGNDETNVTTVAKDFFQATSTKLKGHPPATALLEWIEEEIQTTGLGRETAIEVVFTAILDAGAATFTHSRLMIEKYGKLGDLFAGEETELLLVKTVSFVWVKSPLHIGLLLNMMLREGVIHATTIAKWVFTPDAVQQYSWPYVWGILDETLSFVQQTILVAKKQLKQGSSAAQDENAEMADVNGLEDAVKRGEEDLQAMLKVVFEGFNRVITEHKSTCDADGIPYKDNWFLSALSQMKAIGTKFRVALEDVLADLQVDVFKSSAADHDVKKGFEFLRDSYRS
ncbi:hypothetical protein Poli38472_000287 [Pythium oligandrum]|uniref:MIF4G domain-containing protein n=1 Tax=Pythium oligandrum TaxID=41045 RepID=A0A8K1CCE9_PYTOL|nr:hypothetical protein Poli38472_000287 [Pythium oligandrum]|eukprot:TMW60245.1 hypothetical protein Poli38472_000287 [Pythium oligandrum]